MSNSLAGWTTIVVAFVGLLIPRGWATGDAGAGVDKANISDIKWAGMIGIRQAEPRVMYLLMGSGWLSNPIRDDVDKVIGEWLRAHPKAKIVPVSTTTSAETADSAESKMIYVWVVDGGENLNLVLVQKGCCPGGVMGVSAGGKLEVPEKEYEGFLDKVRAAETLARREKLGVWDEKVAREEGHLQKAMRLKNERKYAEALQEFKKASEEPGQADWGSMADCEEGLGHYDQALMLWDKAIGDGRNWDCYLGKAEFISRNKGPQAAVAWFRKLSEDSPQEYKFLYLLGQFHDEAGRPEQALAAFDEAVKVVCKNQQFVFEQNGWLVMDKEKLAIGKEPFVQLRKPLMFLVRIDVELKRYDEAFTHGTMMVSVGQQLNRLIGRFTKAEVEAGDVSGRLARAEVFMRRGKLEEAKAEIDLANLLAQREESPGYRLSVEEAYQALKKLGPP